MSGPSFDYGKVFVVGCPRSGTTWLHDLLAEHPDVVTTLESALFDCLCTPWWESTARRLGSETKENDGRYGPVFRALERLLAARQVPRYDEWRPVLLNYFRNRPAYLLHSLGLRWPKPLWMRMRRQIAPYRRLVELIQEVEADPVLAERPHEEKVARVARRLLDAYFLEQGGTPRHTLVEKTPSHVFHAPFILEHFPEARIVEVVRDGHDVCVSMDSYKRWMPQERGYQIWLWAQSVNAGEKLLDDPRWTGRVLRLKFEDLKADPRREVARLLTFCDLTTSAELVEEMVRATDIRRKAKRGEGHHYRRGKVGEGVERMSAEDQDLVRRMAGRELSRLGYGG